MRVRVTWWAFVKEGGGTQVDVFIASNGYDDVRYLLTLGNNGGMNGVAYPG